MAVIPRQAEVAAVVALPAAQVPQEAAAQAAEDVNLYFELY